MFSNNKPFNIQSTSAASFKVPPQRNATLSNHQTQKTHHDTVDNQEEENEDADADKEKDLEKQDDSKKGSTLSSFMFPLINSYQRVKSATMKPPPAPQLREESTAVDLTVTPPTSSATRGPGASSTTNRESINPTSSSLSVPASSSAQARTPIATKKTPTEMIQAASTRSKARQKVALAPGHSPMDWIRLRNSGKNLRVRIL